MVPGELLRQAVVKRSFAVKFSAKCHVIREQYYCNFPRLASIHRFAFEFLVRDVPFALRLTIPKEFEMFGRADTDMG